MNYEHPELRNRLAAQYVLGTQSALTRRRMERILQTSAAYRDAVRDYSRLHHLVEALPAEEPPKALREQVLTRIGANISSIDDARKYRNKATSQRPKRSALTLTWALTASVLLSVMIGYVALLPSQSAQLNYIVVMTDDAQSKASWVFGAEPVDGLLKIKAITPQPLPEARVFQLWIKIEGEPQVRSVGLIPAAGQASLSLALDIRKNLARAEKFGISIEPPGGSPTGQPTTTPLYHGKLLSL